MGVLSLALPCTMLHTTSSLPVHNSQAHQHQPCSALAHKCTMSEEYNRSLPAMYLSRLQSAYMQPWIGSTTVWRTSIARPPAVPLSTRHQKDLMEQHIRCIWCNNLLWESWADSTEMAYNPPLKESSTALHTVCKAGETWVSHTSRRALLSVHASSRPESRWTINETFYYKSLLPGATSNSQHLEHILIDQQCNASEWTSCLPAPDPELSGWSVNWSSAIRICSCCLLLGSCENVPV